MSPGSSDWPDARFRRESVLLAIADPWLELAKGGGIAAVLAVVVWALVTERLVPGTMHRRVVEEERERAKEWRDVAEGAIGRIERAVELARRPT